jgi:hypothetical protein
MSGNPSEEEGWKGTAPYFLIIKKKIAKHLGQQEWWYLKGSPEKGCWSKGVV